MSSLIALVDCNNFYASCERLFRPELEGKPVVVLSNNDGCVIARSNEAKAAGVAMGAPFYKIKELLQKHNITHFSSNYELYGDLSFRVMETLKTFAAEVEVYSIDECFLNFGNMLLKNLPQYALHIKETVQQYTGIPVSIGVAPTKTLAKIANRLGKKSAKARGCLILTEPHIIDEALKRTEVGDVWGVGRQYAKFLNLHKIKTAYDLKNAPDSWVKKHLSVVMLRTVKELRGEPCIELELIRPHKQNICTSRSFGRYIENFDELLEATATYAAKCSHKLRKQQSCAKELTVFITTNRYADIPQYYNSKCVSLPTATSSNLELIRHAKTALEQIYKPGFAYKKSGVVVSGIIPDDSIQLNLLDATNHAREKTLMQYIDRLNQKYDHETVRVAAQGTVKKKEWNLRREFLSPCFTTRWSEVLHIDI